MRPFVAPVVAAVILSLWASLWRHPAARGPMAVAAVVGVIALAIALASRTGRRIRGSGRDPADVGDASAAGREHEGPGQHG